MDANRAFDLLQSQSSFTENEAQELARSLGVVWDGHADYSYRNGERVYGRTALERCFKNSVRCRPCGEIKMR